METKVAQHWARELGMTPARLFGHEEHSFVQGEHVALLDGVRASFLLSEADEPVDTNTARSWAWSANVVNHVTLSHEEVTVVSTARSPSVSRYKRDSVETRLSEFLRWMNRDQARPSSTVIDHLIGSLHKLRGTLVRPNRGVGTDVANARALGAFLLFVGASSTPGVARPTNDEEWRALASKLAIDADVFSVMPQPSRVFERLVATLEGTPVDGGIQPHYGIAVRHAGGEIFQQATAELGARGSLDLFGGFDQALETGKPDLSRGQFFTPSGLARFLAEYCVARDLPADELTVYDPACGSGVFLAEALRALQRKEYSGKVRVVGRDSSHVAITVARFVVASASLDWPDSNVQGDFECKDSIASEPESIKADICLMNPPFRAWQDLTAADQKLLKTSLGPLYQNRPDLSMAFVSKARDSTQDGGIVATLLPVGTLASQYAQKWRADLLSKGDVRFIAVLGDHGIFKYATVNIGVLAFENRRHDLPGTTTTVVWADESADGGPAALRELRRRAFAVRGPAVATRNWSIYAIARSDLERQARWTPKPGRFIDLLKEVSAQNVSKVATLFEVKQGVRTGLNAAFLLSEQRLNALPERERIGFRPAIENESILNGALKPTRYIFYPTVVPENEKDMKSRFPTYFRDFIEPHWDALLARASAKRKHPWQLSEHRATWQGRIEPRIVSRYFSKAKGFALDREGNAVMVQGYAWLAKWSVIDVPHSEPAERFKVLEAYTMLFNSALFFELLRENSTNTAGGQVDLSPRYVDDIPVPTWGDIVDRLKALPSTEYEAMSEEERTCALYGLSPDAFKRLTQ